MPEQRTQHKKVQLRSTWTEQQTNTYTQVPAENLTTNSTCYDFVILSSYGLFFTSTQPCVLPPSLFFVIAHSAIHAFLIS